ncbi:protein-tyrosine kinase 6-like isoform X2 [Narcine bancroftii]|uniref:protein-tyrosine kinase 6-like isoform X2 n=1 Tax=Narcine bancroftii TaxID=1343680 RepID=UPI003831CE73
MAKTLRRICPCLNSAPRRNASQENEKDLPPHQTSADGGDTVFTALYDFRARTRDELSFQTGDEFEILNNGTRPWWLATKRKGDQEDKCTGYIPSNYIARKESVDTEPWFAGKLSRTEARGRLSTQTLTGSFLVRESDSQKVLDGTTVRHYRIITNEGGQFSLNVSIQFPSLKELVEYYRLNYLRPDLQLTIPCQKKSQPNINDLSHLTVDNWERPRTEFTFSEKLGSGHFGEVYAGYWNNSVRVAIKTVEVGLMNKKEFQAETQILKKLHHPHLISLYAICTTDDPFYIVTELMKYGSLLCYLRSKEGSQMNFKHLLDIVVQVVEGMTYLESKNYIHRDLAARNVLLGDNFTCKIADFGLARIVRDDIYVSQSNIIPYKWTAPEAIEHGYFSVKSDVWSFGILLYEVVTYGKTPYAGLKNNEVVSMILQGYRMPCPSGCPWKLHDIMMKCWNDRASQRPTFANLTEDLLEFSTHTASLDEPSSLPCLSTAVISSLTNNATPPPLNPPTLSHLKQQNPGTFNCQSQPSFNHISLKSHVME